eukprot:GEZU01002832.1.p1 GENE.GEZU01002832.1~~GEZU01002832.1.p1  ORF type:complete len:385 (-),score=85.39 GEZU01002832.1:656-1810(-)
MKPRPNPAPTPPRRAIFHQHHLLHRAPCVASASSHRQSRALISATATAATNSIVAIMTNSSCEISSCEMTANASSGLEVANSSSSLVAVVSESASTSSARSMSRSRAKLSSSAAGAKLLSSCKKSCSSNSSNNNNNSQKATVHVFNENFVIRFDEHRHLLAFDHSMKNTRRPALIMTTMETATHYARMRLSEGARKIRDTPNAGGNSVISEVLSFEILQACFGAQLSKTEMEIRYFPHGSKKTDYMVRIGGRSLGVSVTRAFNFISDDLFTIKQATKILEKKLFGVLCSTQNLVVDDANDRFVQQILHVFCPSRRVARVVRDAYRQLSSAFRKNTVVVITVAANANYIFTEGKTYHPQLAATMAPSMVKLVAIDAPQYATAANV